MFPAPTTSASSTPVVCTSVISSATASIVSRSRPYSRSPMSDSPESLSRIRRKTDAVSLGAAAVSSDWIVTGAPLTAQLEALELEHLGALVAQCVADLLGRVVDPVLLDEHVGAEEPLVEHAFDDLLPRLLGLRLHFVGAQVDLSLLRDRVGRDVVAADPVRLQRSDVHRDLARQVRGSAADLEEHADLIAGRMRVGGDVTAVHGLEARRTGADDVLAEPPGQLRALFLEL